MLTGTIECNEVFEFVLVPVKSFPAKRQYEDIFIYRQLRLSDFLFQFQSVFKNASACGECIMPQLTTKPLLINSKSDIFGKPTLLKCPLVLLPPILRHGRNCLNVHVDDYAILGFGIKVYGLFSISERWFIADL